MPPSDPPSSQASSPKPLPGPQPRPFISASVLQRLANGEFVAQRRNAPSLAQLAGVTNNRRDFFSPLSVAKRCIPYEPKVFTDRRDVILSLAHALNNPAIEVLLLEGDEGSGTTSVARGVVELMGGGPEQVLWVDVEPTLSDGDLVSFLIGYLNRIAASVAQSHNTSAAETVEASNDAMAQLRNQLAALAEKPVLVVMDHLGSRVNDNGFWNTSLLQELLQFLLAVPSVKVMLVGEHLPTGNVAQLGGRLFSVNLTEPSSSLPPQNFVWQHLAQRLQVTQWEQSPEAMLGEQLVHQLNREDQRIAALLTCMRHSVSQEDLHQWSEGFKYTDPKEKKASVISTSFNESPLTATTLQQHLKSSPLRPLIRRSLLPQQLLSVLALPPEKRPTNPDDWAHYRFSLYDCGAALLAAHLPPLLLSKTHEFLSQQYLAQRKLPMDQRVLPVANSILVQEARYHEEQAQLARLRHTQQKTLQPLPTALSNHSTDEMPAFSQFDLDEIATHNVKHHERHTPIVSAVSHELRPNAPQPTVIVVSPPTPSAQELPDLSRHPNTPRIAPPHDDSSFASTTIPITLQPALSHITSAQLAFSLQQWQVSQASLEAAIQQLQQIETQSQELQAAIHSRLAYVAAINQQWDASRSHHNHAQQYLNGTKPESPESIVTPWLVAQQCLTETLLPESYKPVTTTPLYQRLVMALKACESVLETALDNKNDPYQTFWHAVLPRDTLLAELTFRTASTLDAARRTPNTLPSQPTAHQLYELAYTRLLESNQPFAAASAAANRAALYTEAHEYDNAIPWLQRALHLEEANGWTDEAAESHQRLAKAYAKTQQWQSALHHGDCVLRWLQNNDASVTQHEAISRWQQRLGQWANTEGLPNQAKVYWLQALETLYALRRQGPLTPEQQSRQDDLEAWIRREA